MYKHVDKLIFLENIFYTIFVWVMLGAFCHGCVFYDVVLLKSPNKTVTNIYKHMLQISINTIRIKINLIMKNCIICFLMGGRFRHAP